MIAPHNETSKVWVAGSGRSGTTWLSRMLTAVSNSKYIHEPLHPEHVALPKYLAPPMSHTDERPYIRPADEAETWAAFIDGLFAGQYQNTWTRYSGMKKSMIPSVWFHSLFPRRQVVKSIRSNLLLGWLARNPQVKVVLLLRHPCPTVLSQKQRNWGVDLSFFSENPALQADFLEKYPAVLDQDQSKLSQLAVRWAIENSIPLQQIRNSSAIYRMTYEELVSDPMAQIRSLLRFLDWNLDEKQLKRIESRINVGFSGLSSPTTKSEMLSGWTRQLSRKQIDQILETAHLLGVDIYDESVMPKLGAKTDFAAT